jgi:hypothetical protein
MVLINKPYNYIRNVPPASADSLALYYQEELKKLEKVVGTLVLAIREIEVKVA